MDEQKPGLWQGAGNPLYPEDDDPLEQAMAAEPDPQVVMNAQSIARILSGGYGEAKQRLVLQALLSHLLMKLPDKWIEVDIREIGRELEASGLALMTRVHPITRKLVIGMGDVEKAGR